MILVVYSTALKGSNHSFPFHSYISNQKRLFTINEDHMKFYSNLRNLWVFDILRSWKMLTLYRRAGIMWAFTVLHRTVTNTHLTYVSTMAFFNNSKLQYLWVLLKNLFLIIIKIIKKMCDVSKENCCTVILYFQVIGSFLFCRNLRDNNLSTLSWMAIRNSNLSTL